MIDRRLHQDIPLDDSLIGRIFVDEKQNHIKAIIAWEDGILGTSLSM